MLLEYAIDYADSLDLLQIINEKQEWEYQFDPRNGWQAYSEGNLQIKVLPPPLFPSAQEGESLTNFLERVSPQAPNFLIILIQAGQAALGHYEEGELLNHKVIRKYMVRAKQGKAQTKHLNSKGKSRAGSRVRLAQTEEFFQEINQKLLDWEPEDIQHVYYSSAIHWWNHLLEASPQAQFEKNDPRLIKIPLDLDSPDFEELQRVQNYLCKGQCHYEEEWESLIFHL